MWVTGFHGGILGALLRGGYWRRGLGYPGNSFLDEGYCLDAPETLVAGSMEQIPPNMAAGIYDAFALPSGFRRDDVERQS